MPTVLLHDRDEIAALLGDDPALHVYELGDLDDGEWPATVWYTDPDRRAVVLLYTRGTVPTLIGVTRPDRDPVLRALLGDLGSLLPRRFDAHLTGGAEEALADGWSVRSRGPHRKMALTYPDAMAGVDTSDVEELWEGDVDEVRALYAASYPGNWFDPSMLTIGPYVGIRRGGTLAAVAGVHAWSPARRVAALGNIATDPAWRGQDLATATTAALCRRLLESVDAIGLNVHVDNTPALACYRRLGFTPVVDYTEVTLTALPIAPDEPGPTSPDRLAGSTPG